MAHTAGKIRIDVVSDTVCPWCYIGKRRLEKAIAQSQDLGRKFEVVWHPYQLNPDAPKKGVSKQAYYERKFASRVPALVANLTAVFEKEGLEYTMLGKTGNTLNSHRLIQHAGKQGPNVQNAVVENLFRAYFIEAQFINDKAVLREAAELAGVADAKRVVEDEYLEKHEVLERIAEVRAGVTGVPHFTINRYYELSGAQDAAAFRDVFERAVAEGKA